MNPRWILTAAELGLAAARARDYPPRKAGVWGSSPEFSGWDLYEGDAAAAARLLDARPDLCQFG